MTATDTPPTNPITPADLAAAEALFAADPEAEAAAAAAEAEAAERRLRMVQVEAALRANRVALKAAELATNRLLDERAELFAEGVDAGATLRKLGAMVGLSNVAVHQALQRRARAAE